MSGIQHVPEVMCVARVCELKNIAKWLQGRMKDQLIAAPTNESHSCNLLANATGSEAIPADSKFPIVTWQNGSKTRRAQRHRQAFQPVSMRDLALTRSSAVIASSCGRSRRHAHAPTGATGQNRRCSRRRKAKGSPPDNLTAGTSTASPSCFRPSVLIEISSSLVRLQILSAVANSILNRPPG